MKRMFVYLLVLLFSYGLHTQTSGRVYAQQTGEVRLNIDVHEAAREGDIEAIRDISVNFNSYINEKDEELNTPLHVVCESFSSDVFDVDEVNGKEQMCQDIVFALIHAGADLTARNSQGQTPLHTLIGRSIISLSSIEEIVEARADELYDHTSRSIQSPGLLSESSPDDSNRHGSFHFPRREPSRPMQLPRPSDDDFDTPGRDYNDLFRSPSRRGGYSNSLPRSLDDDPDTETSSLNCDELPRRRFRQLPRPPDDEFDTPGRDYNDFFIRCRGSSIRRRGGYSNSLPRSLDDDPDNNNYDEDSSAPIKRLHQRFRQLPRSEI